MMGVVDILAIALLCHIHGATAKHTLFKNGDDKNTNSKLLTRRKQEKLIRYVHHERLGLLQSFQHNKFSLNFQ